MMLKHRVEFERRQISSWKHFLPFNAECGQVKNRANSRDTLKNKDNIFSFSLSKELEVKNSKSHQILILTFLKPHPPCSIPKFSELIRIYLGELEDKKLFIFQKCQVEIDFSKEDCVQGKKNVQSQAKLTRLISSIHRSRQYWKIGEKGKFGQNGKCKYWTELRN